MNLTDVDLGIHEISRIFPNGGWHLWYSDATEHDDYKDITE